MEGQIPSPMGNFQVKEKYYLKGTDIEKPTSEKQISNSPRQASQETNSSNTSKPAELCHTGDAGILSPS